MLKTIQTLIAAIITLAALAFSHAAHLQDAGSAQSSEMSALASFSN